MINPNLTASSAVYYGLGDKVEKFVIFLIF